MTRPGWKLQESPYCQKKNAKMKKTDYFNSAHTLIIAIALLFLITILLTAIISNRPREDTIQKQMVMIKAFAISDISMIPPGAVKKVTEINELMFASEISHHPPLLLYMFVNNHEQALIGKNDEY